MIILSERVTLDGAFVVVADTSLAELDPFQQIGIPCWLSPTFLDDPNEPEMPFCENH